MLTNVGDTLPVIYNQTFRHLCVNQRYEFSLYTANIVKKVINQYKPNLRFEVRRTTNKTDLIARVYTGDIDHYDWMTWSQHAISFVAPSDSVDILLISQTQNTFGNDIALDDFQFRTCSTNNLTVCP
jgi:hypothetical protein